jgi:polyphosphate kinase 2 (PPK2 family)
VLDDRLQGRIDKKSLARAFDEINEFEAQQSDYGTLIVKLYFDVSAEVQEARLQARSANPWERVIRGEEEVLSVLDPGYSAALAELRANTDTRWSPWRMIDSDDEPRAALSALSAIADAWADAMPAEPPQLVGKPTRAA